MESNHSAGRRASPQETVSQCDRSATPRGDSVNNSDGLARTLETHAPPLEEHPAWRNLVPKLGVRGLRNFSKWKDSHKPPWPSTDSSSPSTAHTIRFVQEQAPEPSSHHANHEGGLPSSAVDSSTARTARPADERRRQHEEAWVRRPRRKHGSGNRPTRSWASRLKSRTARKAVLTCSVSGVFLALILTIYLILVFSNAMVAEELRVILIFMIMILTIIFCHSFIRVAVLLLRGPRITITRVPSKVGPSGYAQPGHPIHVILARDEEMAIESSNTMTQGKIPPPPPAYGLWRSSVRINPDMLYWQRVNGRPLTKTITAVDENPGTLVLPDGPRRPPSYVSDNGVDYVVNAQPRSTAPIVSRSALEVCV